MNRKWHQYLWRHSTFIILTIIGGYLDAYTYLTRGGVFANAQTGNLVLLGVNLINRNILFFRYALPVIAFIAGIFLSNYLKNISSVNPKVGGRFLLLCIETAVVFLVSFIQQNEVSNRIVTILISFITALQYGEFRNLRGLTLATTMCTGMLRSATDYLYQYCTNKQDKQALRNMTLYFVMVGFFIAGCMFGTLGTRFLGYRSSILCGFIFLIAIASYHKDVYVEQQTKEKIRE